MSTHEELIRKDLQAIGIPIKPFMYTLDQVATMISVEPTWFAANYVWYTGRTSGIPKKDLLTARNVAPVSLDPQWRIVDQELLRWCRHKGIRVYERGWVKK